MRHVRSLSFLLFALPTFALLGAASMGCASNVHGGDTAGAGNNGGGGNGGGGNGGGGNGGSATGGSATGGSAGAGGVACQPATEICDGKDNDCDGVVDNVANLPDGCKCNDGETQECYTGMDGTAGVGTCVKGTQTCANGAWGDCAGEVVPAAEQCNNKDDDCNGKVDDMGVSTCGVGACMAMVEKCINGQLQTCVPGMPSIEKCDGIDNNCNQLVDESDPMLGATCQTMLKGPCATGKMQCLNQALTCTPSVMPTPEMCDGVDNDCNGTTDDNIPGTGGQCSTGANGVCAAGTISCGKSGGSYSIDCFSNVQASAEVCDGLDNNCDGSTDEGNPGGGGACDTGMLGACQPGTLNCQNGSVQCTQNVQAVAEKCDGQDNNCDGQVDEGNPGSGQPCGCANQGTTACQNGAIVCNGGPMTYFFDDFKDSTKGWQLGTEWAIGPAVTGACASSSTGNDPASDHTATADNGEAGVLIGGCYTTTLHSDYCMTSPTINTSTAAGSVFFSYWRHLHSDYPSYITNHVDVSSNGGGSWTSVFTSPAGTFLNDASWTQQTFDVTAYKSANFKVRFCYSAGPNTGIIIGGGWNVDDVAVSSAICP